MNVTDIINKKKKKQELSCTEIEYIVKGYTQDLIPDYQMAAFLMAVWFSGMSGRETCDYTHALVNTGERIDLSGIMGKKVDKHSTGGVGDKVTLIALPLAALSGAKVAKMSGRGLGHTGGTIDKLESIPGFRTALTQKEFCRILEKNGLAITSQTSSLTPGDSKIYTLRDVTATVDSIPLIAASIMSKKIASGADCLVLDVKTGSGAFMKTQADAHRLAEEMLKIAGLSGIRATAVISSMEQPLGMEIGNAREVIEAIDVLKGKGPEDITMVALTIAAEMAYVAGIFNDRQDSRKFMNESILSGSAVEKFRQFIAAQGGNPGIVDDPYGLLPQALSHIDVRSDSDGFVTEVNAEMIGTAAMKAGAGRIRKQDSIDYSAGITLHKKTGDKIDKGDILCTVHTSSVTPEQAEDAAEAAKMAFKAGAERPEKTDLIAHLQAGQTKKRRK